MIKVISFNLLLVSKTSYFPEHGSLFRKFSMVLNKNRKPTLSPKTIFQIFTVNMSSTERTRSDEPLLELNAHSSRTGHNAHSSSQLFPKSFSSIE
ncbi:hypothetical protein TYRP_006656 [Tyrophagus putrescentiae]|nr:hypothetical protein TYRP_006656 [Tyrophagus putrescentiae]